jgi:THO complex subunit 5
MPSFEHTLQDETLIETSHLVKQIRQLSSQLVVLLINGTDHKAVESIRKQILTSIVQLRSLNWTCQGLVNSAKESTAQSKQEADKILLDIQNILYQHKHLKQEIEQCESLESKHEGIDLIPLEQFLQENPEYNDKDSHAITLARLKDEEKRRLELFITKTNLQDKRAKLAAQVKALRDDLEDTDGLEAKINKFITEAEPLREVFYRH